MKIKPANIETCFIHIFDQLALTNKQISYIYKKLKTDISGNAFHIKEQWELELNTIGYGEDICPRCHKGVGSQICKEFDWNAHLQNTMNAIKVSIVHYR